LKARGGVRVDRQQPVGEAVHGVEHGGRRARLGHLGGVPVEEWGERHLALQERR
jgi:hypothetical protein